jgi:hypothetical protein
MVWDMGMYYGLEVGKGSNVIRSITHARINRVSIVRSRLIEIIKIDHYHYIISGFLRLQVSAFPLRPAPSHACAGTPL